MTELRDREATQQSFSTAEIVCQNIWKKKHKKKTVPIIPSHLIKTFAYKKKNNEKRIVK
jgi:hypothetical protein